jgi:hypothetical protein
MATMAPILTQSIHRTCHLSLDKQRQSVIILVTIRRASRGACQAMYDFRIPDAYSGPARRPPPSTPPVIPARNASSRVAPTQFSLATRHSRPVTASLTPFLATLTDNAQLVENSATLSPLFATLTQPLAPKSFACHSYKKPPGVGVLSSLRNLRALCASALSLFSSYQLSAANSALFPLHFSAIFCTSRKPICPLFKQIQTLFAKHPGCVWTEANVIPSKARNLLFLPLQGSRNMGHAHHALDTSHQSPSPQCNFFSTLGFYGQGVIYMSVAPIGWNTFGVQTEDKGN